MQPLVGGDQMRMVVDFQKECHWLLSSMARRAVMGRVTCSVPYIPGPLSRSPTRCLQVNSCRPVPIVRIVHQLDFGGNVVDECLQRGLGFPAPSGPLGLQPGEQGGAAAAEQLIECDVRPRLGVSRRDLFGGVPDVLAGLVPVENARRSLT